MAYYYLHRKGLTPSYETFEYIIYIEGNLSICNLIKLNNKNISYCPHEIPKGIKDKFTWDDEYLNIIGINSNIISKYKKIKNFEKYELWENEDIQIQRDIKINIILE